MSLCAGACVYGGGADSIFIVYTGMTVERMLTNHFYQMFISITALAVLPPFVLLVPHTICIFFQFKTQLFVKQPLCVSYFLIFSLSLFSCFQNLQLSSLHRTILSFFHRVALDLSPWLLPHPVSLTSQTVSGKVFFSLYLRF